jgi:hypothetical protein
VIGLVQHSGFRLFTVFLEDPVILDRTIYG